MIENYKYSFIFILLTILTACKLEPQPIFFGSDVCSNCKMTITDGRYGAEIISKKGKIYKFDSAECMIQFLKSKEIQAENIHQFLITDFATPENFTDAKTAHFLISQNLPSPMGADLTGFSSRVDAGKFRSEYEGKILTWSETVQEIHGEN